MGVRYEDIVQNPEQQIKAICQWLNIQFEDKMVNEREDTKSIVESFEKWKSGVNSDIKNTPRKKFEKIFTLQQQAYILERIGGL